MNVLSIGDIKPEKIISDTFTGQVYRQRVFDEKIAKGLNVTVVTFRPGARSLPHTHTSEQIVYVTEGKGIAATDAEEVVITPGMLVYIPPGERHWHGATRDKSFSQISIMTPGKTTF